ncbi:hypothetical protein SF12_11600 [Streptomyces sp. MBRL 601]|nr:hypothetical protein SF12_11600 [Streptomyces sp. MBRL 601]
MIGSAAFWNDQLGTRCSQAQFVKGLGGLCAYLGMRVAEVPLNQRQGLPVVRRTDSGQDVREEYGSEGVPVLGQWGERAVGKPVLAGGQAEGVERGLAYRVVLCGERQGDESFGGSFRLVPGQSARLQDIADGIELRSPRAVVGSSTASQAEVTRAVRSWVPVMDGE